MNTADFDRPALIKAALDCQARSYAPYSHYNVAAAALMASGNVYTGVNVENASFPATICAEQNAVSTAVAAGETALTAIAIVGGPRFSVKDYCTPCGVCRQVLREFADPKALRIILAKSADDWRELTLEQLLPLSFGPDALI